MLYTWRTCICQFILSSLLSMQQYGMVKLLVNPLTPVAISKSQEMIGRSAYILACSITTALHSDINQTAGSRGHLSM